MLTKAELLRTARRKVAGRRQQAVTLAEERHQQATATIPDLARAEGEVRRLGFEAARLAASGAGASAVAEMHTRQAQAQAALDALLQKNGYSAQSFVPHYTCAQCQDTGFVAGRPCTCVAQLARQLRRQELLASSSLSICSFDALDYSFYPNQPEPTLGCTVRQYMTDTIQALQEYADSFDRHSSSLLFYGNAGLGKTHVALAIAGRVLEKGFDVLYMSAHEMCRELERARFDDDSALLDALLETDLLILDDLGTESLTPYTLSCLYTLVNTRINTSRPTIYTTNIVDSALLEKRYTEKIASRLGGSCEQVEFLGQDIRQLKARQ